MSWNLQVYLLLLYYLVGIAFVCVSGKFSEICIIKANDYYDCYLSRKQWFYVACKGYSTFIRYVHISIFLCIQVVLSWIVLYKARKVMVRQMIMLMYLNFNESVLSFSAPKVSRESNHYRGSHSYSLLAVCWFWRNWNFGDETNAASIFVYVTKPG